MPEHNSSPSPDWSGLEAALGSLTPTPPTIDRDQLMYAARRAARPRSYSTLIGALAGCAATLAFVFVQMAGQYRTSAPVAFRGGDTPADRETIDADATAPEVAFAPPTDPNSYFQLRRHLNDSDFAAIDSSTALPTKVKTVDRAALLHELLN